MPAQVVCRLHAVLCELIPGGVARAIYAAHAAHLLESITPAGAVEQARCELAAAFVDNLRRIDAQLLDAKKKLDVAVRASGTSLTGLFGVGPVVAATRIGAVGGHAGGSGELVAGVEKKSRERVLSAPSTGHYIAGWPRDTDLGVIADADGERIGATWLRFFTAADPGYGFVSADVPELTIGVAARWRGRGVGRALLRAVAAHARSAGIGQISLSGERKNFAQSRYLSEGYRIVNSSDADSGTMLKDFAAAGVRP